MIDLNVNGPELFTAKEVGLASFRSLLQFPFAGSCAVHDIPVTREKIMSIPAYFTETVHHLYQRLCLVRKAV
jgi:hypothetical protein